MKIQVSRFNKKNTLGWTKDLALYTMLFIPFMFFTLVNFNHKYETDMKTIVKNFSIQDTKKEINDIDSYNKKYKGKVNIEYKSNLKEFHVNYTDTKTLSILSTFYEDNIKDKSKIDYIVLNGQKLQVNGVEDLKNIFRGGTLRTPETLSKFLEENTKNNNELIVKYID